MTADEFVFCVNSGRAASRYLAELIDTSAEAHGLHEPEPRMKGSFVRMVETAPESESFERRLVKCRAIEDWMREHATKPVYVETSHLFVVTFHDVAVARFPRMRVIFLRRALPLVVKSFVELGFFSDRGAERQDWHVKWYDWHISPSAVTAAIRPIAPDAELDQVDRVIAHLIDVEARGMRFRATHPDIPTVDVRVEELGSAAGVERLFAAFGLSPTGETANVIGRLTNEKKRAKQRQTMEISISVDECRRRIDRYLERAAELGIEPPSSLALD